MALRLFDCLGWYLSGPLRPRGAVRAPALTRRPASFRFRKGARIRHKILLRGLLGAMWIATVIASVSARCASVTRDCCAAIAQ
jgi:hypothetical protein